MWKYPTNYGYDNLAMMITRILQSFPKSEQTLGGQDSVFCLLNQCLDFQRGTRPATAASPENLLEMQDLEPHHRSTISETLGLGEQQAVFEKALQIILELLELGTIAPEKMTDLGDNCESQSNGPHSSSWLPSPLATPWLHLLRSPLHLY